MPLERNELQMVNFADFSGGMNVSVAPQFLAENEYQLIKNFEYDFNRLVTRGGLSESLADYPSEIKSIFYDEGTRTFLVFLKDGSIYEEDFATVHNKVGVLSGSEIPCCCSFDSKVFIASGGLLQYFDYLEHKVETIGGSRICDLVFERFGRLVISHKGEDNLYYSSVGDAISDEAWVDDTNVDSSSKWLEIGYKDNGDIVKVLPIAGDIAVFKSNGNVYMVSGEYPSWTVQLVGKNTDVMNAESITNLGSTIAWVTSKGLKSLEAVQLYGNFTVNELGRKINKLIEQRVTDASKVFNIQRKRQLLIQLNGEDESNKLLCYQYDLGAGLEFEFALPIADVIDTQDDVIVASGSTLHRWSFDYEDDNGEPIVQELVTREYSSTRQLFTRMVDLGINGVLGGVIDIRWANKSVKYIVKKARRVLNVFSACRQSALTLKATNKTELEYIKLYFFEK